MFSNCSSILQERDSRSPSVSLGRYSPREDAGNRETPSHGSMEKQFESLASGLTQHTPSISSSITTAERYRERNSPSSMSSLSSRMQKSRSTSVLRSNDSVVRSNSHNREYQSQSREHTVIDEHRDCLFVWCLTAHQHKMAISAKNW